MEPQHDVDCITSPDSGVDQKCTAGQRCAEVDADIAAGRLIDVGDFDAFIAYLESLGTD